MIEKNKVGLGTFPLTGVFNKVSQKGAEKIVRDFLYKGGFYIDTAPLYGNGEVETILGKALKGVPRENYYLITKTVKVVDAKGSLVKSGKHEDVINGLDYSLHRLGLDYVDCLMVHQPDDSVPFDETLGAIEELQNRGKVKDLAVSNVNLEELKQFNEAKKIKYVQNRFSLINRSVDKEFEHYLLQNEIFLIPYHLLEIGLLTGIALGDFRLRQGDLRQKLSYWNDQNQKVIFDWVRSFLAPLAKKLGLTIGQLCIAWGLHQEFIDFVIVGTTKSDYLSINMKANEIKFSPQVLNDIESAYLKLEREVKSKFETSMREFRGLNEKYY